MLIFKLAWRNIWRNKRRTLITIGSILFAVVFAIFMNSVQKGAWDRMVDNVVNFYYGYLQVHAQGYWEEQSIDKSFEADPGILGISEMDPAIGTLVPRLESFALAAFGDQTGGVLVVGTDPVAEDRMTELSGKVTKGSYFSPGAASVLVAEGVARNLELEVGDTLVLISQGYHGVNAAGKYLVKGLVKFGSPELNKQMVYMPLETARQFFGAPRMLTSLAVGMKDKNEVDRVSRVLRQQLDSSRYEVMIWEEMMPELVEAREVDTAGAYLMLIILYIIIAFGIFGTILMMTREREYEFGILLAVGMKRFSMGLMVWLEIVFLGLLGALAGMLLSFPLVYYFYQNPIDFTEFSKEMADAYEKFGFEPIFPAVLEFDLFFNQTWVVLVITGILAVYPLLRIARLKVTEAMRG